jgi:hypothetical protein
MPTSPPTDRDRARAAIVLEHIQNLRDLGRLAGEDTTENEINFLAMMLRNERHEKSGNVESQ